MVMTMAGIHEHLPQARPSAKCFRCLISSSPQILKNGCCYYPHFGDGETEAWGSSITDRQAQETRGFNAGPMLMPTVSQSRAVPFLDTHRLFTRLIKVLGGYVINL